MKVLSRAEPSRGTLIFKLKPSWQFWQYIKRQILVPTPTLLSNFLIFINIFKTIDIIKVGSEEIGSSLCKCSPLLSLTFVEIKKILYKNTFDFNSKNIRIIYYWKKAHESQAIQCFYALDPFFFKHFLIVWYA